MAKKKIEDNNLSNEIDLDDVKAELRDYVDVQIRIKMKEELEKSNKKLIKEKNKKIFWRNIVIVILTGLVIFLVYLLNSVDYFDKFFLRNNKDTKEVQTEEKQNTEVQEKEEPTLDELKKEYSYLLDTVSINEESEYVKDYYDGNLTNELKKYLVLNNINFEKITKEEDYNLIDEDFFKEEYLKIFDDYSEGSFSYNGNKIRYLNKIQAYMSTDILNKVNTNIKREIVGIKVKDKKVYISTIEGLIKDEKLVNIISQKEVENFDGKSISKYEKLLNRVTYVFDKNKLIDINK